MFGIACAMFTSVAIVQASGGCRTGARVRMVSIRQHEAINDLIRVTAAAWGHLAVGLDCSRCNLTERVAYCDENT
jgi:hypothetical protein